MPDLVLFDIDNTLLEGDSDFAWGKFLCEQKIVDPQKYAQQNEDFYQQYLGGTLDIHAYLKFSLEPLTHHSLDILQQWRKQFIQEKIYPHIPLYNQELVQQHQRRQDIIVLISATQRFITQPIADIFSADDLIATEAEIHNNRFSGEIIGTPCFREGKVTRLQEWLNLNKPQYEKSWCYSDSLNDLPLFQFVDKPMVKNGDPQLIQHAEEHHWTIWKEPSSRLNKDS